MTILMLYKSVLKKKKSMQSYNTKITSPAGTSAKKE